MAKSRELYALPSIYVDHSGIFGEEHKEYVLDELSPEQKEMAKNKLCENLSRGMSRYYDGLIAQGKMAPLPEGQEIVINLFDLLEK